MDDLRQRFAALDRVPAPDVWANIQRRALAAERNGATVRLPRVDSTWRGAVGVGSPSAGVAGSNRAITLLLAAVLALVVIGSAVVVGSGLVHSLPAPTQRPAPSPSWTYAGDAPGLRGPGPMAVVLADGRVLVVGAGFGDRGDAAAPVEAAAIFNPNVDEWTGTRPPSFGVGSATLLADGTVLVAGGGLSGRDAERYDPGTGQWTQTGSMAVGRPSYNKSTTQAAGFTATRLNDGRVLVVGGRTGPLGTPIVVPNAELFDPASGRWTTTGDLIHARADHTATLLADGRVLVAGGTAAIGGVTSVLDSAEIYDPSTGTWSATGRLTHSRALHTATALADGAVIVTGGDNAAARSSTERYDVATGHWALGGNITTSRWEHTATLLRDGRVLVAGGRSPEHSGLPVATTEIYDLGTGVWSAAASFPEGRAQHAAVLLGDGRVLVIGGERDFLSMNWLSSTLIYGPPTP